MDCIPSRLILDCVLELKTAHYCLCFWQSAFSVFWARPCCPWMNWMGDHLKPDFYIVHINIWDPELCMTPEKPSSCLTIQGTPPGMWHRRHDVGSPADVTFWASIGMKGCCLVQVLMAYKWWVDKVYFCFRGSSRVQLGHRQSHVAQASLKLLM